MNSKKLTFATYILKMTNCTTCPGSTEGNTEEIVVRGCVANLYHTAKKLCQYKFR